MLEEPPTAEELARFYSFVERLPNGCHFWAGARSRGKGNTKWYGSFRYRGKVIRAHRFAHDYIGGKSCPPGYHRDHTCVFSLCVNPEHLEAITREENERRKRERALAAAVIKITLTVTNVVKKVTQHAVAVPGL
jgi:hypothetical protein